MKCKETTKSLKRSEITTHKKKKKSQKIKIFKKKKEKKEKKTTNYKILCFAMYKI